MSFFNLRRGGQASKSKSKSGANASVESVDIVRKRAKHRLIGTAVLVLLGVVGFPLLFDSQPRPVPVDIAIEIPNKSTVKPLIAPAAPLPMSAAVSVTEAAPTVAVAAVAVGAVAAVAAGVPAKDVAVPVKPAATYFAPATPATVAAPPASDMPKVDDSARALALLDGKSAPSVTQTEARVVVQVGAFADAAKAREARLKLEKANLKTYAQVVETKDGKRTRVRVGPFASRADAEKAAAKIKSLGLPVSILTL